MRSIAAALGKNAQGVKVASDQGFFLRPSPSLELPFGLDGVGYAIEFPMEHEFDRPASKRISLRSSD